jgi:hypothetical protein
MRRSEITMALLQTCIVVDIDADDVPGGGAVPIGRNRRLR